MPTLTKGAVQDMQLPADFEFGQDLLGGMGLNWLKSYQAVENKDVQISLFYRGTPNTAESVAGFRFLLSMQGVLFDVDKGDPDEQTRKRICSLETALGNAGNNQITNKASGISGPRFFLEKIHVINLNSKSVMAIQGYFHGYDGEVHNHYMGVFFDATPDDKTYCQIEEVVFQAPTWELFERYFPQFQKTLNSIRWT
jgi:hypothetical protein